jgi:hypothetical protein
MCNSHSDLEIPGAAEIESIIVEHRDDAKQDDLSHPNGTCAIPSLVHA